MSTATTPIRLIFVRGILADVEEGRCDDVDAGLVTHVPSKNDTVTLEGVAYTVAHVHYNLDLSGPHLHAFAHLKPAAASPEEINRWYPDGRRPGF